MRCILAAYSLRKTKAIGKFMKTAGPEPEDMAQPARAKKHTWRTIFDIVYVLAIAYFVFLTVAILIAPKGSRSWGAFALHFAVTVALGYGAKWSRDRYDKRREKVEK